jgi:hypothetical protein
MLLSSHFDSGMIKSPEVQKDHNATKPHGHTTRRTKEEIIEADEQRERTLRYHREICLSFPLILIITSNSDTDYMHITLNDKL